MKIKQVEDLTGITSHNIRYYEKERLIRPGRNPVNSYREYTESDVALLKQIKLLRMLDVPVPFLREYLNGEVPLAVILEEQTEYLKTEENRIHQNVLMCQQLARDATDLEKLPEDLMDEMIGDRGTYLYRLERIRKQDRIRYLFFRSGQIISIFCWSAAILICLGLFAVISNTYMDRLFQFVTAGLLSAVFVCMLCMLYQNEKALRKGKFK